MSAEKLLLSDRRTLAYEHACTLTSSTLVIFFSGSLNVRSATYPILSPVVISKGVHYVTPTLAGFGNTSPPARGTTYAVTIAGDISALIEHLYPDASNITLYICGHSFGSVAAQILYASPPSFFPAGRNIRGLLLISAFPPFQDDNEKGFTYTKNMSWSTYISVGPPTFFIPFTGRLLQHALKLAIKPNLSSQPKAEYFVRQFIFDIMGAEEKEAVEAWKKNQGYKEGRLKREMAELTRRSVEKTWEGFLSHADVLHSDRDWKSRISGETFTQRRKVLIVGGKDDELTPLEWEEYLVSKYPNAGSKWFVGGHVIAFSIWTRSGPTFSNTVLCRRQIV